MIISEIQFGTSLLSAISFVKQSYEHPSLYSIYGLNGGWQKGVAGGERLATCLMALVMVTHPTASAAGTINASASFSLSLGMRLKMS